jgi:hypothetical protein
MEREARVATRRKRKAKEPNPLSCKKKKVNDDRDSKKAMDC